MKLFEKLTSRDGKSNKEKLNVDRAANKHITEEDGGSSQRFRKKGGKTYKSSGGGTNNKTG